MEEEPENKHKRHTKCDLLQEYQSCWSDRSYHQIFESMEDKIKEKYVTEATKCVAKFTNSHGIYESLWNFPIKLVNLYFTDNMENGMDQKEIE